jgi:hypothetical protein
VLVHCIRVFSSRKGIIARSPWKYSTTTKAIVKTTHIVNVAMTEPLFHVFDCPPHCRAKVKQTSEENIMAKPGRSSWKIISFHVALGYLTCLGTWKKRNTATRTGPPAGLLWC